MKFPIVCLTGCLSVSLALSAPARKVAVIGATGRLGRQVVQQLSNQGVPTRCLVRSDVSSIAPPSSFKQAESSAQVAALLSTLPGVELVKGDINDGASLANLVQGTTDCLALHGPVAPKPFFRALLFPSILYPETTPSHPKQLNYEGIQKLIVAMEASATCKRLVRVTGIGENPWSFFSILINALSGLAKGWNYEGEQLLRKSDIAYTIVRPGIMMEALPAPKQKNDKAEAEEMALGLADNGQDMKVTPVTYEKIADLIVQSLDYPNCQRATLTAMNLPASDPSSASSYGPLLEKVQPDSREFPESLLDQHRQAARVGGLVVVAIGVILLQAALSVLVGGFWKLRGLI